MHPRSPGASATGRLTAAAAALALLAASPGDARAQIGRDGVTPVAPAAYAITNARIVTVSGAVIDGGTVVVRDGLIAAVGAAARTPVPADARTIDGAGLTVYPGLIDAVTSLGVPAPRPPQGNNPLAQFLPVAQAGQQAPTGAPNSRYPVGLQPEVDVVSLMRLEGDAFESSRGVGITAALTAPRDGIFAGRSAVIGLAAGADARDILVRSPVALHMSFTPLRGQFPNSLMGVFAAIRQMFLDAQRHGELQAAYARNPRGMRRPDSDPSLEALLPALRGEMPVFMLASTQREIERALSLAEEFRLRAVIVGGNEAWKVAPRLAAARVPVVATLNFPRRPANQPADADPEPMRVLQERVDAPKNAARLAEANVRFAFTSGGMTSLADFLPNLRKATDAGLPKDRALRALTLDAADILGVADRMGSVEVGKIANLTVVRGDLFDANARVTQVFVDGRPYEVRAPQAAAAAARGASGSWNVTVTLEGQERQVTLALFQDGDRLRGGFQGDLGNGQISNASVMQAGESQTVRFTATVTLPAGTEEATFEGTVSGNTIRGTVQVVGHASGTFVGTRPEGQQRGGRPGGPQQQRPPQE